MLFNAPNKSKVQSANQNVRVPSHRLKLDDQQTLLDDLMSLGEIGRYKSYGYQIFGMSLVLFVNLFRSFCCSSVFLGQRSPRMGVEEVHSQIPAPKSRLKWSKVKA
jgi:hypothetical protein